MKDESGACRMKDEYELYDEDNLLKDISVSLAEQVNSEIEEIERESGNRVTENLGSKSANQPPVKKKMKTWKKVLISVASTFGVLLLAVVLWAYFLLDKTNFRNLGKDNVNYQEEEFDEGDTSGKYDEVDPDSITWGQTGDIKKVEGVHNILLLAEEKTDGSKRGRTDVIMIATINTLQKSIKLTSIMRDTYVQIPGYLDNRINTAYRTGDTYLILETVKKNFDVALDGYILVDFDGFEDIIDALGGVEITLTEKEASYLNRTNYISNPAYRNVEAGAQVLNGSQALGYSRIRKVKTADGLGSDWGRNARQKTVLSAVFAKYKSSNILDVIGMMDDILSLVTTDLSKTELISYATTVLGMGVGEIETFGIPVKKGFTQATIRKMDVLVPDLTVNNEALHNFIFGTDLTSRIANEKALAQGESESGELAE